MNTVVVGGDIKVSNTMLVGGMFVLGEQGDFADRGYKLRQPVGTVYAGFRDGPWYVGVTAGAGNLDFPT
jgi:hypothetical protein